jgi:hypothetical protein
MSLCRNIRRDRDPRVTKEPLANRNPTFLPRAFFFSIQSSDIGQLQLSRLVTLWNVSTNAVRGLGCTVSDGALLAIKERFHRRHEARGRRESTPRPAAFTNTSTSNTCNSRHTKISQNTVKGNARPHTQSQQTPCNRRSLDSLSKMFRHHLSIRRKVIPR